MATWHGAPIERPPVEGGAVDPEVVEYVKWKKERDALRTRLYSPRDHVLGMLPEVRDGYPT